MVRPMAAGAGTVTVQLGATGLAVVGEPSLVVGSDAGPTVSGSSGLGHDDTAPGADRPTPAGTSVSVAALPGSADAPPRVMAWRARAADWANNDATTVATAAPMAAPTTVPLAPNTDAAPAATTAASAAPTISSGLKVTESVTRSGRRPRRTWTPHTPASGVEMGGVRRPPRRTGAVHRTSADNGACHPRGPVDRRRRVPRASGRRWTAVTS
jgi:hypothetical protein